MKNSWNKKFAFDKIESRAGHIASIGVFLILIFRLFGMDATTSILAALPFGVVVSFLLARRNWKEDRVLAILHAFVAISLVVLAIYICFF